MAGYSLKAKPGRLDQRTSEPTIKVVPAASRRTNGRKRQEWRKAAWVSACGLCAMCGKLMRFPDGFELDHIVPLCAGGADDPSNMQVLCVSWGDDGKKGGCHVAKTAEEAANGWVETRG